MNTWRDIMWNLFRRWRLRRSLHRLQAAYTASVDSKDPRRSWRLYREIRRTEELLEA